MTVTLPKTTSRIETFIKGIERRLKRLEEDIGSATDAVLQFLSIREEIGVADTVYIYSRDVNDSFLVGNGIIGVTPIGDRRSASVLLWSGG